VTGHSEMNRCQQQDQGSEDERLGGFHAGKGGQQGQRKAPLSSRSREAWVWEAQVRPLEMRAAAARD
jgi:hypothetical protein